MAIKSGGARAGGRREANTSDHDTSLDGKGYHTPAETAPFEPR